MIDKGNYMDEKPPSDKDSVDTGSGDIPPDGSMVRRPKNLWGLLGYWHFYPVRSPILGRCVNVLCNIRER